MNYNVEKVRNDFPTLEQKVYAQPLVYLDNAASTLKPRVVIERMHQYYNHEVSNVHRGAHFLSDQGTRFYESARQTVQRFLGAPSPDEIVFTRGTTEAINLVASSYGDYFLRPGDEILISEMEHHSNIVPWQMLCERKGCRLLAVPVTDAGELDVAAFEKLLSPRTKIVALVWCSNALGTVNPIRELIIKAHAVGAVVLVDAAQAVATQKVNVGDLDCDFLAFSGHKVFGPYGVGALYGKLEHLQAMPPYQGGGSMISEVTLERSTYLPPPHRFEAGTPAIADVIGLAAALQYLNSLGIEGVAEHERDLLAYATEGLRSVKGLRIIGEASEKISIVSFVTEFAHPSDIGSLLDRSGIAVRTGHHCCQPLMKRFGVTGTVRASLSIYNTRSEVDNLVRALERSKEFF